MEQALKRLLITPFIFFILLAIVFFGVIYTIGVNTPVILLAVVILPIISLKISAKLFPGDNLSFHKKESDE